MKQPPEPETPTQVYNRVRAKVMDMATDAEEAFRLAGAMCHLNPKAKELVDKAHDIHFDRSVRDLNQRHGPV